MGLKNGRCNWPRGKVLGGSSVLNYMLYVRGNRHDYDGWRDMGNEGWGYSEILQYFTKSEDNRNPYLARPGSPYHRAGGLLTVQEAPWKSPLVLSFVESGQEVTGYPNRDINGKYQTGFMVAQVIYYETARKLSRIITADRDQRRTSLYIFVRTPFPLPVPVEISKIRATDDDEEYLTD